MTARPSVPPRPWHAVATKRGVQIRDADGRPVANIRKHSAEPQVIAELILRAVNCHDALIAAVEWLVEVIRAKPVEWGNAIEARAAADGGEAVVARARGERP